MTSATDEIANLRAGLEDILDWCHTTSLHCSSDVERETYDRIAAMARRALKTPRASKVIEPQHDLTHEDDLAP